MSQVESGVRSLLGHPAIYNIFQNVLGARGVRRDLIDNYVKPTSACCVLDIGCGTAEILDFLPVDARYFGFDQSRSYIDYARIKYGTRGEFHCDRVEGLTVADLPEMDIVLGIGILHHLNDQQALQLMTTARDALTKGGRLITLDPCYQQGQSRLAKWLIDADRGQDVREQAAYLELAHQVFEKCSGFVVHRTWIPYTHHIMVCQA